MAKVKNKKNSGLADKVHKKKKFEANKKKLNPFEVHINKEKLKVLGKKTKHDRGLPGVSRAKAIKKVCFKHIILMYICSLSFKACSTPVIFIFFSDFEPCFFLYI